MKLRFQTLLLVALLVYFSSGLLLAQNVASSVTWPLTSDGTTITTTGQIGGTAESITSNLTYGGYGTGSGTPPYYQRIKMASWPSNQLTQLDSVYIQFAALPAASYTLVIDSVVFNLCAVSTQDMMVNIYYSTDSTFATKTPVNYTTSVAARVGKPAGVFLNSSAYDVIRISPHCSVNAGEKFYLRFYPWVDSSTSVSGKYISVNNLAVYATAVPIPLYAAATWPLASSGSGNVSGLITASNILYDGTNLYHYGYQNSSDRWTNHLPSNGAWPAETSPNFARYAQFKITPQIGGTFYADTIRFSQINEFTTTLRMALYYSNDSTFATKSFIADTTVPGTTTTYQYIIPEDTVANGNSFYLRFYPYDLAADPSWKLVDVSNVTVAGKTTGVAIQLPIVTTTAASYISSTFLTTGGNVSADGGGTVTARGVCWSTSTGPTIANSITTDGSGTGTFTSSITGLTAGTTYYIRAYATNVAGTGYGSEIIVSTLSSIVAPTVTTTSVSNIMAVTAKSGGNVTNWGGASVTAKGICWNTDTSTSYPTIANSKTVDGTDIGSFSSALSGLSSNTQYFVRAYAANSGGTGYGNLMIFTTQTKSPDTTVVVAQDGSGNYTTIGAALRNVPTNYTGTWRIFVKKGNYHEKDTLASGKVNVVLEGEDRDSTLLWNWNYSDDPAINKAGTSSTYTVTFDADDFIAKNITFENTYWPNRWGTTSNTQAVAVSANGDRQQFFNCAFNGYQDTYYTRGSSATGRAYHKNCFFKGTVDYIFGRNICVFDSCTFMTIRAAGTITAGATDATSLYGYVFRNCRLLGDTVASKDSTGWDRSAITASNGWLLGRPWQSAPRTVFINCYESANMAAAGWTTMSVNPALYTEYNCWGPGAFTSRSIIWPATAQPSSITGTQAANYSLTNIFARNSASSSLILYDWYPSLATAAEDMNFTVTAIEKTSANNLIPHKLTLGNYPNPFNPETNIQFTVASSGRAVVKIYNILGQEVAQVFDGQVLAGQMYKATFGGSRFASGVYFCAIESNGQRMVNRMLLLK